ncbi:hypothetical protein B0H11DRAFT_2220526 [Mycena galericulata]|nr:hypothetical protein B0H11DRAFT_2220526 [Mycena galericulata]
MAAIQCSGAPSPSRCADLPHLPRPTSTRSNPAPVGPPLQAADVRESGVCRAACICVLGPVVRRQCTSQTRGAVWVRVAAGEAFLGLGRSSRWTRAHLRILHVESVLAWGVGGVVLRASAYWALSSAANARRTSRTRGAVWVRGAAVVGEEGEAFLGLGCSSRGRMRTSTHPARGECSRMGAWSPPRGAWVERSSSRAPYGGSAGSASVSPRRTYTRLALAAVE